MLFLGAGVSVGAGLPDWQTLLDIIATQAGLAEDQRELLAKYDVRDQATYLADCLAPNQGSAELIDKVNEELSQYQCYSLTHGLLVAPVQEAVTTNYDRLYERAVRIDGRTLAVLPTIPRSATGDGC